MDSAEGAKKPKPKNQPKIHRRRNEEIPKQFFCSVQSCGKAYGSYAALYTHMRNKHSEVKPPNMPNIAKTKNSHPGRPKIKKEEVEKVEENEGPESETVTCKICLKQHCECLQYLDTEEKNKTIDIMSSQKFTSLINQIGELGNQEVNWVRRAEEDYEYKSPSQIEEDLKQFNLKYALRSSLSDKLVEYLSFSSKYWDPASIDELYSAIFAIAAFNNHHTCVKFIQEHGFPKMQGCIKENPNQFKRLDSLIRGI